LLSFVTQGPTGAAVSVYMSVFISRLLRNVCYI
jgi:hypothetical protein